MGMQTHFNKFHNKIKLSNEDEAYSEAREKDNSITKEVKEAFKDAGYSVTEDFIQGSFSTHTAIKSLSGDFDIDRAIVVEYEDAPENPVDPKKTVLAVLEKRGFSNAKIKRPCVTADYATQNLHIDFPIYRKNHSTYELAIGKLNSDENNREWSASDPKGLKDWIKDKSNYIGSESDKLQQFNRVVRYLKRWRDVQFSVDVAAKVYSIGLTVMAKSCFSPFLDSEGKPNDLLALKNTVSAILNNGYLSTAGNDQFQINVYLPTSPYRDIFDGSSLDTGTQLKNKLTKLEEKLQSAIDESTEFKQCQSLNWLFGDDFEIPEKSNNSARTKKTVFATAGAVGTSQGA